AAIRGPARPEGRRSRATDLRPGSAPVAPRRRRAVARAPPAVVPYRGAGAPAAAATARDRAAGARRRRTHRRPAGTGTAPGAGTIAAPAWRSRTAARAAWTDRRLPGRGSAREGPPRGRSGGPWRPPARRPHPRVG